MLKCTVCICTFMAGRETLCLLTSFIVSEVIHLRTDYYYCGRGTVRVEQRWWASLSIES